jgi:hypothetical protein
MTTIAVQDPRNDLQAPPPLGYRVARRRHLAVPLNVTVLRSGVPDAVPGRSVDVCEGGLGAILAAEVHPGELVGVEFRLPDSASVLAKARVCYQDRLRCGLQFLGISAEQKAAIEAWASERPSTPVARPSPSQVREPRRAEPSVSKLTEDSKARPARKVSRSTAFARRKIVTVLAASVIVAAAVGWWQWEQSWQEIESHLPGHRVEAVQSPMQVSWEVMQGFLVHQSAIPSVPSRMKGMAVLTAVIGRDGSVVRLHPVSGPDALTRIAMDSVQWWKFEPYRVNGTPVEVETSLAVDFH